MKKTNKQKLQSGYATLTMGVILLITVTLAGLYLGRSGILDLRSAANKSRAAEAFADAEANLEYGLAWFSYQTGPLVSVGGDGGSVDRSMREDKLDEPAEWTECKDQAAPSAFLATKGWSSAFQGNGWRCKLNLQFHANIGMVVNPSPDTARSFHLMANQFQLASGGTEWIYVFVAEGKDAAGEPRAVVQQAVRRAVAGDHSMAPPPPLMGAGTIDLNGSFNLVANPNGACALDKPSCGQPVSIWSKSAVNEAPGIGNWASCQLFEYKSDACKTSPLSSKNTINQDVVANDPTFPTDMFSYVFGVGSGDYKVIKDRGEPYVYRRSDCSDLPDLANNLDRLYVEDPDSPIDPVTGRRIGTMPMAPIIWVTGDCDVPNAAQIGTLNGPDPKNYKPVILVVEPDAAGNGDLKMSSGTEFSGMVFMFQKTGNTGQVSLNGGAKLFGALLSNNSTATGQNINGTFDLVYDMTVMKSIRTAVDFNVKSLLSKVPGTWADYLRP